MQAVDCGFGERRRLFASLDFMAEVVRVGKSCFVEEGEFLLFKIGFGEVHFVASRARLEPQEDLNGVLIPIRRCVF